MTNIIKLIEGEVYYHAGFADEKYTIPVIDTYIYKELHPEVGHIFFDINAEIEVGFSEGNIQSVYDRNALINWLANTVGSKDRLSISYQYING